MKIAVITDSNSGFLPKDGEKYGIYVLPMPFTIDEEEYLEGINLSYEEFYTKQTADADIFTSQPAPMNVMELWDTALESHDAVIHIPMASPLSGSCQTAMMLAQEDKYDGKVWVIDNRRISFTQKTAAIEAAHMAKKGFTPEEIKKYLDETADDPSIYLTVADLKYLKKGGRISPAAAAIGTLLKIKPVLSIQKGKIDAFAKARTIKQAKQIMIDAIKADIKERFGDEDGSKSCFYIVHSNALEAAKEYAKEVKEAFPGYEGDIAIDGLSLSVTTHTGQGTLAVGVVRKTTYLEPLC